MWNVLTAADVPSSNFLVSNSVFSRNIMDEKGLTLRKIVQQSVAAIEREVIGEALRYTGGNKAKAARLLGIDYKTIYEKVKKLGISASVNAVFGQIGNEDGNDSLQTGSPHVWKDTNELPGTDAATGT